MRRGFAAKAGIALAVVALVAAACQREPRGQEGEEAQERQSLLRTITDRGVLRCGVNETVPGFGFLNPDTNEIEGFDVDFCKAIAAAVFNTPEVDDKIQLVSVSAEERFSALRAGNYDVLVRNTTWTSSRDGTEGIAFTHTNFYDSQGMMVPADSEFESIEDMNNTAICVTSGTTTELNLADRFAELDLNYDAVTFEENPQLQEAFIGGRCQGWTSDRSQLAGIISQWPDAEGGPDAVRLLPDIMSKEPLTPAVLDGDTDWQDAVTWVIHGLINAEELGVDSDNVEQMAGEPPNTDVANLLGASLEEGAAPLDSGIGLQPDFMVNVLTAVGNYGEIYDRHVGALGLERGLNDLWSNGGLQFAPPFR